MEHNPTDYSQEMDDVLDLTDERLIKALRAENDALRKDLQLALPYVRTVNYSIALVMQIEAHLEGREPWEPKLDAND